MYGRGYLTGWHSPRLGGVNTIPSGSSLDLYNTADESTNYEKLTLSCTSNVFTIAVSKGGSGSTRSLKLATSDGSGLVLNDNGNLQITGSSSAQWQFGSNTDIVGGIIQGRITTGTSIPALLLRNEPGTSSQSFSASSGTQRMLKVAMSRNQSGTAAATGVEIDVTGTGGSGAQRILDCQSDSTSRFYVEAAAPTSGNSVAFLSYHNGTSVTIQRVTLGAADSGGSGFKLLRVPN